MNQCRTGTGSPSSWDDGQEHNTNQAGKVPLVPSSLPLDREKHGLMSSESLTLMSNIDLSIALSLSLSYKHEHPRSSQVS
jgi:hypothetical protein